jgi:hypothetical protein
VFPWVEQEQAALLARTQCNLLANDIALKQFLRLLVWLRRVLLQDAAILFTENPASPIFQFSIFKTPAFRGFAASSKAIISDAEEKCRMALDKLPDHLVRTLRGVLSDTRMEQQQEREAHRLQWSAMEERFTRFEGLVGVLVGSKGRHRKGQLGECLWCCVARTQF